MSKLEQERKFLVRNFRPEMIPSGSIKILIEQTYLSSPSPDIERRVRMSVYENGAVVYEYAEKVPTGIAGERVETEYQIDEAWYQELLLQIHPKSRTVNKVRSKFSEHGHCFELDVYVDQRIKTSIEVEVKDMSLPITPPTGFELVEVTGNKAYSNWAYAMMK